MNTNPSNVCDCFVHSTKKKKKISAFSPIFLYGQQKAILRWRFFCTLPLERQCEKAAIFKSYLRCQLTYRQPHFILKGSRRALRQNKQKKLLTSSEVCGVVLTELVPKSFGWNTKHLGTNLRPLKTLSKFWFTMSVLI